MTTFGAGGRAGPEPKDRSGKAKRPRAADSGRDDLLGGP